MVEADRDHQNSDIRIHFYARLSFSLDPNERKSSILLMICVSFNIKIMGGALRTCFKSA